MIEIPVLIVGGGPAGLTASILLSRLGIESLLVTKYPGSSPLPRARGVHARAMEILRVAGVEPDLRRHELALTPGAEWRATLAGPPLRSDEIGSAAEVSPCEGLSVSQDIFEDVLREHARSYERAQIRTGVAVSSVDGAGTARLATGEVVRAKYVIAADGAHSPIRTALGIGLHGPDGLGTQQMIAFRADLSRWTGTRPRGIYFLTESGAALIHTHPGHRWVLSLPVGGRPEAVLGVPVEVLGSSTWTAAAQSAIAFRAGPVFLAGDAAHRVPPVGATGVSSALHDVHNLTWKLAAVLRGEAGPGLLDSYDRERRPVAERNAAETGAAWERMSGGAPFAGRSIRQIDMGYQYESDVVVPDGSLDADPPGADYRPSAAPGGRAPHLWLGSGRSTIDLFDRTFVLLTAPGADAWRAAAAALPVAVHTVDAPEFPQLYGVTGTGAVLVRPDGHVAWRAAGCEPVVLLVRAVARATAQNSHS